MEDLVRRRIDDKRATIITTNVSNTVLASKYPALYNACQESFEGIKVDGKDFREEIKEQIHG